jgi:hypothetical protein
MDDSTYQLRSLKERTAELEYLLNSRDALVQSLLKDKEILQQELILTRSEVVAQANARELVEKEVERLKAGNFSDDELQNLCHQFPPEKVCSFRNGCTQYQVKLFGQEAVQADMARELRYALKQVAYKDGGDRLAELLAETLLPESPT